MKRKKKTAHKPLVIAIHGDGVAIDAKFTDSQLADMLTTVLKRATSGPVVEHGPTAAPAPEHDFDVVRRVVEHAEPRVLQAILDLTNNALEQRRAAS